MGIYYIGMTLKIKGRSGVCVDTYGEILELARELFPEQGYNRTSLEEIRARLGLELDEFQLCFRSKEELFLRVMESLLNDYYILALEGIQEIAGTIEKIDFLLNFSIRETEKYSLVFIKDVIVNPILFEKVVEMKKDFSIRAFKYTIEEGIASGEIRELDIDFVSKLLIALVDGLSRSNLQAIESRQDIEDFSENFYDFIKYGLMGN